MSATDTVTYVPELGVLAIEQVTDGSRVVTRLKYRIAAQNPDSHRYKTLAIHDSHGAKSLIVEGTLSGSVSDALLTWAASEVDIVKFFKHWSDSVLTLEQWLGLVKTEPWLNQDQKEQLERLYAVYLMGRG